MASNYNRRTLPPEVLVENGKWSVIRRRQTIDDILRSRLSAVDRTDRTLNLKPTL